MINCGTLVSNWMVLYPMVTTRAPRRVGPQDFLVRVPSSYYRLSEGHWQIIHWIDITELLTLRWPTRSRPC